MPINFPQCPVPTRPDNRLYEDIVAYGHTLIATPVWMTTITHAEIVVVTGDTPCGHALLCLNKTHYLHIAGFAKKPHYMNHKNFQRYLGENGKQEVYRVRVAIPNPEGLRGYISQAIDRNWVWMVIPNNCYAFVETALDAGGALGSYHKTFNCPQKSDDEVWKAIHQVLGRAADTANPTGRPAWK